MKFKMAANDDELLNYLIFFYDIILQDRQTEVQNGRQRWRKLEMSDETQNLWVQRSIYDNNRNIKIDFGL